MTDLERAEELTEREMAAQIVRNVLHTINSDVTRCAGLQGFNDRRKLKVATMILDLRDALLVELRKIEGSGAPFVTNAQRAAQRILADRLSMLSKPTPDGLTMEGMIRCIEDEAERRVVDREFRKLCSMLAQELSADLGRR